MATIKFFLHIFNKKSNRQSHPKSTPIKSASKLNQSISITPIKNEDLNQRLRTSLSRKKDKNLAFKRYESKIHKFWKKIFC
jgi:hypothetical protein